MHGGDKSMVQKMFSLQEVLRQIDALSQVAVDLDYEDVLMVKGVMKMGI